MAIYTIAHYQVNSRAVDKVKRAIEEFVRYVVFTDYDLVATNNK
jgi:hypothetical protein